MNESMEASLRHRQAVSLPLSNYGFSEEAGVAVGVGVNTGEMAGVGCAIGPVD